MARYYAGQDGSVELGGQPVAKVAQWSLTATTDALEVTTLSERARTFTAGVRGATGALTVLYYQDAPVKLLNQLNQDTDADAGIGATARLKLKFDTKFFEFDAVLTSAELSCVVGEVMRVNVNFTMSGDFIKENQAVTY
jgi:hypothetical protein